MLATSCGDTWRGEESANLQAWIGGLRWFGVVWVPDRLGFKAKSSYAAPILIEDALHQLGPCWPLHIAAHLSSFKSEAFYEWKRTETRPRPLAGVSDPVQQSAATSGDGHLWASYNSQHTSGCVFLGCTLLGLVKGKPTHRGFESLILTTFSCGRDF